YFHVTGVQTCALPIYGRARKNTRRYWTRPSSDQGPMDFREIHTRLPEPRHRPDRAAAKVRQWRAPPQPTAPPNSPGPRPSELRSDRKSVVEGKGAGPE